MSVKKFEAGKLYVSDRRSTLFKTPYYTDMPVVKDGKKFFAVERVEGGKAFCKFTRKDGLSYEVFHFDIEAGLFREATAEEIINDLPDGFLDGLPAELAEKILGRKGSGSVGDAIEAHELLRKLSAEIKANLKGCASAIIENSIANGTMAEALDVVLQPAIQKAAAEIVGTRVTVVKTDGTEKRFDTVHYAFERVLKLASVGLNVMLVGRAGTGKTALAYQVAEALELPFSSVSCTAGMGEAELRGRLLPVSGGGWEYMPSDFVRIYENGGVFLFDEIDAADSNTLLFINQALANGRFNLDIRRENTTVRRHEKFICIAAANTFGTGGTHEYAGREKLDEATLDRFRAGVVAIDYDPALETKLVHPELLGWARNTRGKLEAAMIHRPLSTRFLIDCTKAIAAEVMTVEQAIDTFQLGLSDRQKKAIN